MSTSEGTEAASWRSEPVDLLVRAGFLYPVDGQHDVILDGEVAVRDGLIVHAGPARPDGHWAPRERIDRPVTRPAAGLRQLPLPHGVDRVPQPDR